MATPQRPGLVRDADNDGDELPSHKGSTYLGKGSHSTFVGCEDPRIEDDHLSAKVAAGDEDDSPDTDRMTCAESFGRNWFASFSTPQKIGLVMGPLLAIIASSIEISEANPLANDALAATLVIVCWWIFEVIPIPATSLLPLLLFPLASVEQGRVIAAQYYNFVTFLLLGAFLVVVAVEKVKAHKRFALWALQYFGARPRSVLLGFMSVSGILSMFASNTSTTILMIPVINGFLEGRTKSADGKRFKKAALLGVAYGATSMGITTIIGTAPNAIFALIFSRTFPDGPSIDFRSWFVFAFPIGIIMLLASWAVLCLVYLRGVKIDLNRDAMRTELAALGPVKRDEWAVGLVLLLMIVLWLIRPYTFEQYVGLCAGDPSISNESDCEAVATNVWRPYVDDATVACFGAVLMFLIPSASRPGKMLLDESAFNELPWAILLLFGAGFAIARAFDVSGLSFEIGAALSDLTDLPPFALVLILTAVVCYLTELVSNTATVSLFTPILLALAVEARINPLLLTLPATVATSLAYQLPTATPPNAVVFATGKITFWDMIKGGAFINVIGILVTAVFTFASGYTVDDLSAFPAWAEP